MASELNVGRRLETIIDLVDPSRVVADIGCDHGYVTAELILQNKAGAVIASDISEKSLNKAILLCSSLNISYYVSFRVGDGFENITKHDKVKFGVIAGMGGLEIIKILENRKFKIFNFVLQPMRDVIKLREYLIANRFKIVFDKMIKEGDKYYNIIKVTKGRFKHTQDDIDYGYDNIVPINPEFVEYLRIEEDKMLLLYSKIGEFSRPNQEKYDKIVRGLKLCKEEPRQLQTN